jgi:hypothetical protein
MTVELIGTRLQDLFNVLFYCSELQREGKKMVFKTNERICINQERGSLFTQLTHLNGEVKSSAVRTYKVPPEIEIKIRFALQKIVDSNWGGFSQPIFLKETNDTENEY